MPDTNVSHAASRLRLPTETSSRVPTARSGAAAVAPSTSTDDHPQQGARLARATSFRLSVLHRVVLYTRHAGSRTTVPSRTVETERPRRPSRGASAGRARGSSDAGGASRHRPNRGFAGPATAPRSSEREGRSTPLERHLRRVSETGGALSTRTGFPGSPPTPVKRGAPRSSRPAVAVRPSCPCARGSPR